VPDVIFYICSTSPFSTKIFNPSFEKFPSARPDGEWQRGIGAYPAARALRKYVWQGRFDMID